MTSQEFLDLADDYKGHLDKKNKYIKYLEKSIGYLTQGFIEIEQELIARKKLIEMYKKLNTSTLEVIEKEMDILKVKIKDKIVDSVNMTKSYDDYLEEYMDEILFD